MTFTFRPTLCFVGLCLILTRVSAQVPFGHEHAIKANDTRIIGWASHCEIMRGPQQIGDTTLGLASVGTEASAIGAANQNGVVSLGDGGQATLTFDGKISNVPGPDFVVFENGFNFANDSTFYLELAFAEVSSDGIHFVRFPATSLLDTLNQRSNFVGSNPKELVNLAGNYITGYGTPFDLEELKDSLNLDINRITHVRLIDAVGSINPLYATRDQNGNLINDPWPTPFASSGFDLDAVGAIGLVTGTAEIAQSEFSVYPNPVAAEGNLYIRFKPDGKTHWVVLTDIWGKVVQQQTIDMAQPILPINRLSQGIYTLTFDGLEHTNLIVE